MKKNKTAKVHLDCDSDGQSQHVKKVSDNHTKRIFAIPYVWSREVCEVIVEIKCFNVTH